MKSTLIQTFGILTLVLLLADLAAAVAMLATRHSGNTETEPEILRIQPTAAPKAGLPIAKVSYSPPPLPVVAEPAAASVPAPAVEPAPAAAVETAPVFPEVTEDAIIRAHHVSRLTLKTMITHAGQAN